MNKGLRFSYTPITLSLSLVESNTARFTDGTNAATDRALPGNSAPCHRRPRHQAGIETVEVVTRTKLILLRVLRASNLADTLYLSPTG
jgi:hypothetical protein